MLPLGLASRQLAENLQVRKKNFKLVDMAAPGRLLVIVLPLVEPLGPSGFMRLRSSVCAIATINGLDVQD